MMRLQWGKLDSILETKRQALDLDLYLEEQELFLLTTMKKEEGIDFDNEEMEDTFKMQIPMMVFKNICVNEGPEFCM